MGCSMELNRKGEVGAVPFRSGRFFNIGGGWYFSCRGGVNKGPFDSRHLAEVSLTEHLRHCDMRH